MMSMQNQLHGCVEILGVKAFLKTKLEQRWAKGDEVRAAAADRWEEFDPWRRTKHVVQRMSRGASRRDSTNG